MSDIHNLFIDTVLKAPDNPVSDHTHQIYGHINLTPSTSHTHNFTFNDALAITQKIYGTAQMPYWMGFKVVVDEAVLDGKMVWLDTIKTVHMNQRTFDDLVRKHGPTYTPVKGWGDSTFTNQPAKAPMSTIDKIKAERREKREREVLEAKFEQWDVALGSTVNGDVVTFTVDDNDSIGRYAAIFIKDQWHTTDGYKFDPDAFIARLIERNVQLNDLQFMEPLE